MNFKRVAALLLAGAMVMTAVPVYAKGDDVTLSVSIWDTNQEPGIKEILADFTEKTGIKTEISVVKWDEYWTMLEAGAQGGSLPDVFWMHSNESQRYMSNDMLLDLTDKIKDSDLIDPENYPEDIWGLYKKTWNFACTCRNDGTHGIVLGEEKQLFWKMTFIHVLSW